MPYYVYKIQQLPGSPVKNLEKLSEFEGFKDAKAWAKHRRQEEVGDPKEIKIIFAKNELEAEEQLSEHRDAPILKEWEK